MIGSGLIMIIRDSARKGKSAYAIGKEQNISKNTAKKYMQVGTLPEPPHKRGSILDPFKPQVNQMMHDGIFNCVVILETLQQMGYTGGKTIIKDYVHVFRPPKAIPAVPRYETRPGKQAQMDWGICQYLGTDGEFHKVPAFVMTLGYSRTRYVEFTKRCDLKSLERCILNAFEYFGGVPDVVLTDNMKTVVLKHEAGKTIFLPAFESFCADMGFKPSTCKVRRPQTKGKVERSVRYLKENFLPGRRFTDLYDLNRNPSAGIDCRASEPSPAPGAAQPLPLGRQADFQGWIRQLRRPSLWCGLALQRQRSPGPAVPEPCAGIRR